MDAKELEHLPEAPDNKVGLLTDGEYALIYDAHGKAWSTEIIDGVRMKRRHYHALELDL